MAEFCTTSEAQADATAPDWETVTHDVKCPLCGYNLRGLTEPRCPECGYPFEWDKILNPNAYRHPYLFEHYPNRNVRSFFLTLFHQRKPRQFWKQLDANLPTAPRRIVLYWFLYTLAIIAPVIVGLIQTIRSYNGFFPISSPNLWADIWRDVSQFQARPLLTGLVLMAGFPWLNFLALMVFQQSMRRSRIRPVHVLRCAIYSGDVIFWYAIGIAIAFALADFETEARTLHNPIMSLFLGQATLLMLMTFGLLLMMLINAFRLLAAYRRYLKFDHAFAAVMLRCSPTDRRPDKE